MEQLINEVMEGKKEYVIKLTDEEKQKQKEIIKKYNEEGYRNTVSNEIERRIQVGERAWEIDIEEIFNKYKYMLD
jgi:uncharacterized protein YnzC (UPF0291/DUF896 family)